MIIKSKTNLSVALILVLATFAIINNLWSYNSLDSIPLLSSSDLIDVNKGKTYHFAGRVRSIKHTDKLDFINLANNEIKTINSTIWPSIGFYDNLNKNDSVRITGTLDKYKNKWQINPLSAEHIHLIESNTNYEIIDLSQAITKIGEEISIGPVKAEYAKDFISSSGGNHLKIIVHNGKDIAEGILFEGSWNKKIVKYFNQKEIIIIDAKVTEYKDAVSLVVNKVNKANQNIKINPLDSISVNLSDAIKRIGETLIIGPVYPESFNVFKSKNGKKHLRFKVKENQLTINGIMWEGNWDDRILKIFNDEIPMFLKSEVGTYNNDISLDTKIVIIK